MVSRRLDFLSSLFIVYIIPLNGIEEACNGNEIVCAHDWTRNLGDGRPSIDSWKEISGQALT